MTVKKVLSVVLSAVVLLASMLTVSAAVEAKSVTVTTSAYDVTVKVDVPDSVVGTMTVQIIREENGTYDLFAMDDSSSRSGSAGAYYYEFTLKMPARAQTHEDYVVRIGNNVIKKETTFPYTSIDDKINFYNGLITQIAADSDGIDEYLNLPTTKVPVDITEYNEIKAREPGVIDLVNDKIATLTTLVSLDLNAIPAPDADERIATATTNDDRFQPLFVDSMNLARIAAVTETDWETVAGNAITATTFDEEYYVVRRTGNPGDDELNDEILLDVADTYDYFKSEGAAVTTLELAEYQKVFDKATLLLVADTLDYASVKDAFLYYQTKGSIAPEDMTNITDLINAGKDADLWKNLKTSGYTDAASLVDNAESIAETMVANGALNTTPIGGGGGGAGGSSTIDKPSTPGASMGIVSDVEIKPAEPVNPVQPDPVEGFTDLVNAEWSREAVEYLAEAGVINGKSENSFAPNDAVTREEGAKIIVAAFNLLGDAECDFADVSSDRWSYAYIAAAVEAGIITGYGEEFGPTDTMTREQAATIIFRAAEKITLELSGEKSEFTDEADTSDWAADAIAHLAADGVINGMGDGTFAPKATLTRAQLAQLVYNVLVMVGGVK